MIKTTQETKKLNERLETVNDINQEIIAKTWNLSATEYNSILNALKAHTNQVEVYQARILNCGNVSQADTVYADLELYHQQQMNKLKGTANSFIQKCVNKANELISPEQVNNLQLNNPVINPNNDLLQKIQELQEKLAQKDNIINSLSQGMKMADVTIVDLKEKNTEQKSTIADQKITIDDLREDKIMLKEKVSEQKIKIDTLTDANLEQVEKIHKVSDKYLDLKTHFVDLVHLHQEDHVDYVPVVDLAGLNLDL